MVRTVVAQESLQLCRRWGSRPDRLGQGEGVRLLELLLDAHGDLPDDISDPEGHIFACSLGGLDVGVDSVVGALLVEQVGKGEETAGLASLARGVEQEVLLLGNQPTDLLQVDACQRR